MLPVIVIAHIAYSGALAIGAAEAMVWTRKNLDKVKATWWSLTGKWPKESQEDPLFLPFKTHNKVTHCEICDGPEKKSSGGYSPAEALVVAAGNAYQYYEHPNIRNRKLFDTYSAQNAVNSQLNSLLMQSKNALIDAEITSAKEHQHNLAVMSITEANKKAREAAVSAAVAYAKQFTPERIRKELEIEKLKNGVMCPKCGSRMTKDAVEGLENFPNPTHPGDWYCTTCNNLWPGAALKKVGACKHRPQGSLGCGWCEIEKKKQPVCHICDCPLNEAWYTHDEGNATSGPYHCSFFCWQKDEDSRPKKKDFPYDEY